MNKKGTLAEFLENNLIWLLFFVLLLVGVGYLLAKRITG